MLINDDGTDSDLKLESSKYGSSARADRTLYIFIEDSHFKQKILVVQDVPTFCAPLDTTGAAVPLKSFHTQKLCSRY